MNKKVLFLSLAILLTGCSKGTDKKDSETTSNNVITSITTTSTITSNVITTEISPTTSENVTSTTPTTEEIVYHEMKISEIRDYATSMEKNFNKVNVYESTYYCKFEAKELAVVDAITTQAGYGSRYKVLVADETGYLYVKIDANSYDYMKKYQDDQSVYTFQGNISIYKNEIEVTSDLKPVYHEGATIDVNFNELTGDTMPLSSVYTEIDKLTLNSKGIAYSRLVNVNLTCLAEDFENSNAYFTDGTNIINIHGSSKLTNKFTKGQSYNITGALSMFNYRPGLEYVSSRSIEEKYDLPVESLKQISFSEIATLSYTMDEGKTNPTYTNIFKNAYIIKGYVNYYLKNGSLYVVLDEDNKEDYYSTINNATNAHALFFKNENCVGLQSEKDVDKCELLSYLDEEVTLIVFPYMWNTNKYFQIYYYSIVK